MESKVNIELKSRQTDCVKGKKVLRRLSGSINVVFVDICELGKF